MKAKLSLRRNSALKLYDSIISSANLIACTKKSFNQKILELLRPIEQQFEKTQD